MARQRKRGALTRAEDDLFDAVAGLRIGGKFFNGAITAAFSYAASASGDSGQAKPTLSKGTGGVAFVGGFFDEWSGGPALSAYEAYIAAYSNADAAYFTWDQSDALAAWIDANGPDVTVYGHSWGGDTAASVVASGHYVDRLNTVDPVGWFGVGSLFGASYADVAAYVAPGG